MQDIQINLDSSPHIWEYNPPSPPQPSISSEMVNSDRRKSRPDEVNPEVHQQSQNAHQQPAPSVAEIQQIAQNQARTVRQQLSKLIQAQSEQIKQLTKIVQAQSERIEDLSEQTKKLTRLVEAHGEERKMSFRSAGQTAISGRKFVSETLRKERRLAPTQRIGLIQRKEDMDNEKTQSKSRSKSKRQKLKQSKGEIMTKKMKVIEKVKKGELSLVEGAKILHRSLRRLDQQVKASDV